MSAATAFDGEFLEIAPPRRVVQTWSHDWDQNHPTTTVTYELDDVTGRTLVAVRHDGFGDPITRMRMHAIGWERVLMWLGEHLSAE